MQTTHQNHQIQCRQIQRPFGSHIVNTLHVDSRAQSHEADYDYATFGLGQMSNNLTRKHYNHSIN